MNNFQVYLGISAFFRSFFLLAKHVGNINSYQNVNGIIMIDHKIRRNNGIYEKQLFAQKCRFFSEFQRFHLFTSTQCLNL